jgi:site-specific DNA-methyltransferase (adenine-specific)
MHVEMRPIGSIKPYDQNPRVNDAGVDAVAASMRAFGVRQPIVVDEQDVIIVGHTRYKAALKLGMTEVPVHVAVGLTPEQARAYRIADNQTANLSDWDYDLLPIELAGLREADFELGLLGFDPDELARLLDPTLKVGLTDPDDVPEPPDEAVTQPGDLWVLGEHRLLCGDSTEHEHVRRLMGGQTARMMFTDPPWNVGIGQDSNPRHRQRPGLQNDSLSPEDFRAFLDGFVGATKGHIAGDVYCVLGASEWPTLDRALRQHGFHWSATLIWVKDVFVLGRSKYHRRYEPIWYGWPSAGKSSFGAARDLDDVWEIPRPRRSEEHPTMKPVELVVRAMTNSSRTGDSILDPFGGSGTTLIAAEQTGRRAFLLELDPGYCDTIVRRWESYSGKSAERTSVEVPA